MSINIFKMERVKYQETEIKRENQIPSDDTKKRGERESEPGSEIWELHFCKSTLCMMRIGDEKRSVGDGSCSREFCSSSPSRLPLSVLFI